MRYFVILTDDHDPQPLYAEAAPTDPAAYADRYDDLRDDVYMGQAGRLFCEVTAETEQAAERAAVRSVALATAQRLAAEYAQEYAEDRADEDDAQAAPEPDRRPGAGQLALCAAGPKAPPKVTRSAYTQDLPTPPKRG
ncbi:MULTISPECIES: hypothetical protein [unclassified Streptomyces]|uniref:hypothetical protein n=1 Tax=unclassified Streptomyces TaxID=2593676 RepID=UPI0035D88CED